MAEQAVIRCGIYCRMSVAADDEDTVKVDHQEKLCREAAARLGWEVHDVYPDNNRSAWKRNRKRPEWDRMLADVEAGTINAIMVYHGDRLVRQPDDLGALLKLADGKGIKLASPTGTRDLGSPEDRFILYIEVAMAMRESDNTSRRRKNQYERWAREGRTRPGGKGGRAFGFDKDGMTHVPAETTVIREASRRILAGESIGSVGRDLAARGVVTPAGLPMSHITLRKLLTRPRTTGLMPDGVSPARWQPVLERAEWEALRAVIETRAAQVKPNPTRRYLLTGLAKCGLCGTGMRLLETRGPASRKHSQQGYSCPACHKVFRSMTHLDAYVTGRVIRRLANPANESAELNVTDAVAAEMLTLEERRAETVAVIENLASHPGQRIEILARALESFDRRLAELRETAAGQGHARVLVAHQGISAEEFGALPLSARRSIVDACFQIVVLPASSRGPGFRPADVQLIPR